MSIELCVLLALLIVAATVAFITSQVLKHSCVHEWETIDTLPVYENDTNIPCAIMYVLKCKKCGEIRQKEVKHNSNC